jgi:L-fucose mutarotase
MLKGLSPLLSPDLLAILMRMGHGDDLVIADGNFPAESMGQRVIRADGHSATAILDAVLTLFPIDTFVTDPIRVMQPVDPQTPEPPIWTTFRQIIDAREPCRRSLCPVERFAFYDLARSAFAVIATGETAIYANIILKKGVVHAG